MNTHVKLIFVNSFIYRISNTVRRPSGDETVFCDISSRHSILKEFI